MSSKTKIVVLRMKEIIYTAIFIGLGILLLLLLLVMFRSGKNDTPASANAQYIPVSTPPLSAWGGYFLCGHAYQL